MRHFTIVSTWMVCLRNRLCGVPPTTLSASTLPKPVQVSSLQSHLPDLALALVNFAAGLRRMVDESQPLTTRGATCSRTASIYT